MLKNPRKNRIWPASCFDLPPFGVIRFLVNKMGPALGILLQPVSLKVLNFSINTQPLVQM